MSAVIYAAIVVMWAVVLVPMWLRRHDAATESRSVDRFSTAMRTLSRRTSGTPGRRYVVMPRRGQGGVSVHVSGAAAATRPPRRTAPSRPGRGRPSLVARRRRLLLGLLALTALTFLLAAAGVVSWPLQFVVDVILVAFCLHLRAQARRAVAVARQRRRATVAPAAAAAAAPMPSSRPAYRPAPAETVAAEAVLEATGTDGEDYSGEQPVTWEPVPVPPPTYTMKPTAPAYEADAGYTTPSYAPVTRPDAADVAPAAAAEGAPTDLDLDEILERRWAVND